MTVTANQCSKPYSVSWIFLGMIVLIFILFPPALIFVKEKDYLKRNKKPQHSQGK